MAKILRAIQPNAGVRAYYRMRLIKELDAMQRSIVYWLKAAYRSREEEIVGDASPANDVLAAFRENMRRWMKRWELMAGWLAPRIIARVDRTTTTSLKEAFKAAGFTVKFDNSRLMNSRTQALIAENVNLIKSISQHYLTQVEGIVMRGVSAGRDLGYISEALGKNYGVTKRRAAFIARDQVDKATQVIQRTHDEKLGITEGIWVHLPGMKTSRETHEAMNGQRFSLSGPDAGLYDSDVGENVLPGFLPGCRCTYRRVLPEFGD